MRYLILPVILSLLFTAGSAIAQDRPAAATTTAPAAETPADIAFKPLQKKFDSVFKSLQNVNGVSKEDRPVLEKLRERFVDFTKQFPGDTRGIAGELTISRWLGEQDRVDACYERLLHSKPDAHKIRTAWIDAMMRENRFGKAAEVLADATFDDEHVIEAKRTLAECYYADDRYEDSLRALESIPASALEKDAAAKSEVETLITQRKEDIKVWEREQQLRLEEDAANNLPLVKIQTSRGPIVVTLFENEAPNTVANFIDLVNKKSYDDTRFYQVLETLRIEGGDPNTHGGGSTSMAGQGTPGYYIADELGDNARKNFAGAIGMARSDLPNTAGCNFYLTIQPNSFLNGKRTVFGRVIQGLDVVRSLKRDDVIESMTVMRHRDHVYTPTTLPLSPTSTSVEVPVATPPNPSATRPAPTDAISVPIEPVADPTAKPDSPPATQPAPATDPTVVPPH